jgi:hypothetical protein
VDDQIELAPFAIHEQPAVHSTDNDASQRLCIEATMQGSKEARKQKKQARMQRSKEAKKRRSKEAKKQGSRSEEVHL